MTNDISDRVGRFFGARAKKFDRIYRETALPERTFNRVMRRAIYERSNVLLREVERLGAPTLLDVGAGSGVNSLAALEAGASAALGVDLAPEMIELAKKGAAEAGLSDRCRFETGDFTTWPSGEKFDVVAALGVLDYVRDSREFILRMAEFASRSIVASFPGRGYRGVIRKVRYELRNCPLFLFDEAEVEGWVKEAGMTFHVEYRDPSGFVAVGRR